MDALATWRGFFCEILLTCKCCFRLLLPKPTRRNYPLIVAASEVVSVLMPMRIKDLSSFYKYPKLSHTNKPYAATSRYSLSLESCRRCPQADNFHFRAYIFRYASKEEEAKKNDSYAIQMDFRGFHIIEKGKMTNLTGFCIMTLAVLTSCLMTCSKLRLNLTYMHRLNHHWQHE